LEAYCTDIAVQHKMRPNLSEFLYFFFSDTDKWVCCRCVAELEANSTEPAENIPLVVGTDSGIKVDGKQ